MYRGPDDLESNRTGGAKALPGPHLSRLVSLHVELVELAAVNLPRVQGLFDRRGAVLPGSEHIMVSDYMHAVSLT